MALSVLLLYTSNQIGSTYGEYNTSQKQDTAVELCKVFPGQVEQLLQEFGGHLTRIAALKATLGIHSITAVYGGSAAIEGLSLDDLDSAAAETSQQITAAASEIGTLETQLSFNAGVWLEIMQEVASAARILAQIGGYMVNLEPNCMEIRNAQFFEEFQSSLSQSGVLSESLVDTLTGILNYLTSIHEIGGSLPPESPVGDLLEPDNQAFLSQEPILTFIARAYAPQAEVSEELRATYEQLNTEMSEAKNNLSSDIDQLRDQQAQIAEAKAKLLEQTRKEEEARQAEVKKQEEAAEKAKKDAEKPDKDKPKETPPAEKTDPQDKDGTDHPAQETPASASPSPAATAEPLATPNTEGSNPESTPAAPSSEQPSAAPAAPVTPVSSATPAPSADPVPSATPDPDSIKGGE